MRRRRVLRVLGAGAVAGSAGCSSLAETVSPPPYLEAIRVKNYDVVPHEVRVAVEQHGDLVYETTFDLGAREPREYGGPYRPWEHIDCEWTGRGPFEVTCTVDSDRTATARVDRSDSREDEAYAAVEFRIRDTGNVRDEGGWVHSQDRHTRCDEPTPTPD